MAEFITLNIAGTVKVVVSKAIIHVGQLPGAGPRVEIPTDPTLANFRSNSRESLSNIGIGVDSGI